MSSPNPSSDAALTALLASDESRDEFDLDPLACPGVFYPTLAADGVLSRIRTPGGLLTARQCRLLAAIAETFAGGQTRITNRANVQLRALEDRLPDVVLHEMQREGLASNEPLTDHLRNVMASPLAGLDPSALLDTRPLVAAIVEYLRTHPRLAALPAKFSIGLDGGERASIAAFPNDVLLRAMPRGLRVLLRLGVEDDDRADLGLSLATSEVVPFIAALADWYVEALPVGGSKPRLRQLVAERGVEAMRAALIERVPSLVVDGTIVPAASTVVGRAPIGVQAQHDGGRVTVGLAPRLDGWSSAQLRALAEVAERFGGGELRLSPWRTVLVPGVSIDAVDAVNEALEAVGLSARERLLIDGIVACVGSAGCASGGADTVRDASKLAALLEGRAGIPASVHFSGCAKRCAQRRPADVTLIGSVERPDTYDIFASGRLEAAGVTADAAVSIAERLCANAQRSGASSIM